MPRGVRPVADLLLPGIGLFFFVVAIINALDGDPSTSALPHDALSMAILAMVRIANLERDVRKLRTELAEARVQQPVPHRSERS